MVHRRRAAALIVTVGLVVAACAAGPGPVATPVTPGATSGSPAASAEAGAPTPPRMAPSSTPSPTPRPTEVPGPPAASLVTASGGSAAGELGTFSWDGLMSDAPWIVPPRGRALKGTGPFAVQLVPALPVTSWTAAWAGISGGTAGTPRAAGEGSDARILVEPPPLPGDWSLHVKVTFGPGRSTSYFWRVTVLP